MKTPLNEATDFSSEIEAQEHEAQVRIDRISEEIKSLEDERRALNYSLAEKSLLMSAEEMKLQTLAKAAHIASPIL